MKNSISYKTVFFLTVFFSIICSSCSSNDRSEMFESDFGDIESPTLEGTEYRPTSSKDWQVSENRMECIVSNENRNLKLMTRELGHQKGTLEMTVRVGFFNKTLSNRNKNWAGFRLGSKGELLNPKKRSKLNNGIKIGVCTNGALFIGEPSPNYKNQEVINALSKGLDLKIVIIPIENNYTIDFSTLDASTGKVLANISKKHITNECLMGEFDLISNFEGNELNKINNSKSVWFEDWKIKGTKVKSIEIKTI